MSANLSAASFEVDLRAFIKKAELDAVTVVRRIALEVWKEVTGRSPVDTGRFRAAWMTNLDEASDVVPPEGTYAAPAAPDLSAATLKNRIFVTNGVSYAVFLEEGSSQQAPAGIVRVSLAQVQAELDTLIAKNTGGATT